MIRLIFTEETRERLRHERIHHPHPRVRQRLEALYLKSEGRSHQAICASLGITKPTLIGYLRLYQEGGWAALTGCRFHRTQSALAPYEGLITTAFAQKPPRTLVEASARIADLTGIERSPAQVGQGAEKVRVAPAQDRGDPRPGADGGTPGGTGPLRSRGADPAAGGGASRTARSFFLDAAHFVHGLFLSWVWCVARCWQPTPSGRHRLSVLGALNATTHQLITVTTDAYINSQHVGLMLYKLAALGLTVPITVVLDNARYQRCGLVQEIAAHLRSCLEKQFIYLQALGGCQFEHGNPDHIFSGGDENLEILRQSPEMAQPGKSSFHDPALGDYLKLTFFSRRFVCDMESQFQFFADKSGRGTSIAGIARKGLDGGITLHGGFQNRTGGQGIGKIRGMNVNGKKVPQNIHDEVAFVSLHLFVAINAALLASILSFNAL